MVLRDTNESLQRERMVVSEVSFRPRCHGSAVFARVRALLRECEFRILSSEGAFRGTDGELPQAEPLFSR